MDISGNEIYKVEAINEKSLAMSNVLISSKYKATIQELKITYLALQKVQLGQYERNGENIYIKFRGRELQRAMNVKGNSFFERLAETSEHMTGRTIGIVDPENRRFMFVPFVTLAKYEEGELTIRFAPEMEKYILNIEKNFTYLLKDTMMNFKREYSFKLYEVLKSYSFYPKDYKLPKSGKFQIEIGLSELKLTMGIVNAELDTVKSVLSENKFNPNYDKAVAKSPERLYDNWGDFKKRVLDPSIKEINENTDIEVSYDTGKAGKGGKIHSIIFLVQDKKYLKDDKLPVVLDKRKWKVDAAISDEERFFRVMQGYESISHIVTLRYDEITMLLEKCNFDVEYFNEKVSLLKKQKLTEDFNVMGFMTKAIEENWKESSKPNNPKSKHGFEERDYDLDELEKKLLNR